MKPMMIAMLFVAAVLLAGEEPKTRKTKTTMQGQIVDLHCYTSRGAKGAEHAGCANACISRDVPAGFVADDGKLYLLVNEAPVSVKEKVAGKAGKPLSVTGTIVERDGIRVLQLDAVTD